MVTPTAGFSTSPDIVVGALFTLSIGGGLIGLAPEFTERTTDRVLEEPGETFLYGLGVFLATLVVVFLLAITIVGIVLVVPLVIAFVVVGQVGYLAAGRAVVDDWGVALLVAVVAAAFAGGVPVLGDLLGFVLACLGDDAWYLEYRDDGPRSGGTDDGPSLPGADGGSTAGGDADVEGDGNADGDADGGDAGDAWTAGFDDRPNGG